MNYASAGEALPRWTNLLLFLPWLHGSQAGITQAHREVVLEDSAGEADNVADGIAKSYRLFEASDSI
ncbi:hypothetical protein M513_10081 [Trichuris suis]|uniref:Uncharacterized protein n=1 Tax=Trichuris suis TaxID=68888 RepID=A0A085LVN7_9BILA|nr:hypothetical protein M513_10081 [Trichuris suis]